MVAATSTVPAGYLICFVLVDFSLGDSGQYLMVVLELLFLVSQISDDMLLGAIVASLGIWITRVMITICYLVIRN
jgi:hypothetical protein